LRTFAGNLRGNRAAICIGHNTQRPSRCRLLSKALVHAGPLQVIQIVERPGHAGTGDGDTGAGHEHHLLSNHCAPDPFTFRGVQRDTAVMVVVAHPTPETQRILVTPGQPTFLHQRQGGRIRHVGVQDRPGMRVEPMDPGMDKESTRFDRMPAFDHRALAVDQQHVANADLLPMQALRVDQVTIRSDLQ